VTQSPLSRVLHSIVLNMAGGTMDTKTGPTGKWKVESVDEEAHPDTGSRMMIDRTKTLIYREFPVQL